MKRYTLKPSERVVHAVLLVVSVAVVISIWHIPDTATSDLVGPKLYPWLLAIMLFILSGLILAGVSPSQGGAESITLAGMLRRFFPLVLFTALYVVALPSLGFLITTTALLLACFYLLGERRHLLSFVIAISFTFGTYILFVQALGIQLSAFPM